MGRRSTKTKRRAPAPKVPCGYCGRREATETDHVPPKGLFTEREEPLLIRVPACHHCNNAASHDEEYLIWALTIHLNAKGPIADAARARRFEMPTTMRRRRMARQLAASRGTADLYTPAGIYLGSSDTVDPQIARVNRALCKVVRGVYFHETGTRVPDDHTVRALLEPPKPLPAYLPATVESLRRQPQHVVVDGGFEYWFVRPVDQSMAAMLLMLFYRGVVGLGFVLGPPAASAAKAEGNEAESSE